MSVARRVLVAAVGLGLLVASTASFPSATDADSPFFDDDLDGVWVGTLKAKSGSGTRTYPLLVNLDTDSAAVRGVALMADDLGGEPATLGYTAISDGTRKGKKLKFSVGAVEPPGAPRAAGDTHSFVLRPKKGKLKGNMSSTAPGIKKSKVELHPISDEAPLQQVWVTSIASLRGRADGPVALLVLDDGALSGAGFVGDLFGDLSGLDVDGDQLTGTLNTSDGAIDLDLELSGRTLEGTFAGAVDANVTLAAGDRATEPTITKFDPSTLPAGKSTLVTLKGKNLADGFLLHFDHVGVYAGVPTVTSTKAGTVSVFVPDSVSGGTELGVQIVGGSGTAATSNRTLTAAAATALSFRSDVLPTLVANCATSGCHLTPDVNDPAYSDGAEAAGGLSLERAEAYNNLVNRQARGAPAFFRVKPGDSDDSYWLMKLRGDSRIVGDRMPLGGPFLDAATLDLFAQWIDTGAER